ncbi:MAG TPA: sulfite exporter TauE/SafE family protein [Flavitalea sp.]|nr:sulfite exporter TauE/SafE family protein [Flavitalea sp.]
MKISSMDYQVVIILILIGLAAGVLSGLVGVGGGIILVPALVYFLHYNQHQAQGTSLGVLTFPVTLLAFLSYYRDCVNTNSPIELNVILIIAAGFIVGGFLGSFVAIKIDQQTLKKLFALILFYTGIKMLDWDKVIVNWMKHLFT